MSAEVIIPAMATVISAIFGGNKSNNRENEALQRTIHENQQRMAGMQSQLDAMQREKQAMRAKMESERRDREQKDAEFNRKIRDMEQKNNQDRAKHAKEINKLSIDSIREQLAQAETHLRDVTRQFEDADAVYELHTEDQGKLVDQVHDEKTKIKHFEEERNDPSIRNIVLIGMTGDGKSTFGNRLAGDSSLDGNEGVFLTSDSIRSETQIVAKTIVEIRGQKVSIADTPGIADSEGNDRAHINNVVSFLRGCGGVNQFVLVKNNANNRWSVNYRDMLRNFEHILGEGFWEYVTIVLSHVEGRAGMIRFERNVPEVDSFLRRTFPASSGARLPVIPCGYDDYETAVERLVFDITPSTRYSCDRLTSPLDDLEAQLAQSQAELLEEKKGVDVKRLNMESVRNKKENLERRLRELERR